MKPTLLKPGRKVACGGHVMTFVLRERGECGRSPLNYFQCDAFRGINGPDDTGVCTMNDHRVVTHVAPVMEPATMQTLSTNNI